jgi:hypothetical protein
MPCPSTSWFGHPSNTWWRLEIKKLPIKLSSPSPCYVFLVATKCLSQHPLLEHSQPTFLPQYERSSSPPAQNSRKNYYLNIIFMYKLIFIFLDSKLVAEMIPYQMVAVIPWIQSSLNFFIKTTAVSL